MDTLQPPLLLIPSPPEPLDVHAQIPRPSDNLFERIIRDPQVPDRPMRERQCTEMLRAVLVACPTLATSVLKWLGQRCGVNAELIEELDWTLETEQPIGAKRDDLRIEGYRSDEDGPSDLVVLWTIEVKVAAPLHESGRQDWDTESLEPVEVSNDDPEMVSQLVNYDNWLAKQEADHRAGFLLAIRDATAALPKGLSQCWQCFTWTDLALELEQALAEDVLPASERPFAKHMLGFIRQRLWDPTDMSTSRLELDDVALLRALSAIGPACSSKIKNLVGQLKEAFRGTGVDFREIKTTTAFFDRSDKASYYAYAECVTRGGWVTVNAGVVGDVARVWCISNWKPNDIKQAIRKLLQDRKTQLLERNPNWVISDPDQAGETDVELSLPLISVLAEEDWQTPLINFVRDALDDLNKAGILEALVAMQPEKEQS